MLAGDHDHRLNSPAPPVHASDDPTPDDLDDLALAELAADHIQDIAWAGQSRYQQATVEDASDDEDLEPGLLDESQEDAEAWNRLFEEEDTAAEDEYTAISVWDELAESFVREGLVTGACQDVLDYIPIVLT